MARSRKAARTSRNPVGQGQTKTRGRASGCGRRRRILRPASHKSHTPMAAPGGCWADPFREALARDVGQSRRRPVQVARRTPYNLRDRDPRSLAWDEVWGASLTTWSNPLRRAITGQTIRRYDKDGESHRGAEQSSRPR